MRWRLFESQHRIVTTYKFDGSNQIVRVRSRDAENLVVTVDSTPADGFLTLSGSEMVFLFDPFGEAALTKHIGYRHHTCGAPQHHQVEVTTTVVGSRVSVPPAPADQPVSTSLTMRCNG